MTYFTQHPGFGLQAPRASFELQGAVCTTHVRHHVCLSAAAAPPARSGRGRNRAEAPYLPLQTQRLLPFSAGWREGRIPGTEPTRLRHRCSDLAGEGNGTASH